METKEQLGKVTEEVRDRPCRYDRGVIEGTSLG